MFLLASLNLRLRDAQAAVLLAELAAAHDVREVWAGLAAIRRVVGDLPGALAAATACLGGHAVFPGIAALAPVLAAQAGLPGWCGLDGDGRLTVAARDVPQVFLDEAAVPWRGAVASRTLPRGWRGARRLIVRQGGAHVLGSPIDIQAIRRLQACVREHEGGLAGWAWHPADPERRAELTLLVGDRRRPIRAEDATIAQPEGSLLSRARGFAIPASQLGGTARVIDGGGRDLLGSPLFPGAITRAGAQLASCLAGTTKAAPDWSWLPLPTPTHPPRPAAAGASHAATAVVVVIDAATEDPAASLRHVRATTGAAVRVIAADARPEDRPPCVAPSGVTLLEPRGASWAEAANAGLVQAAGCDVALLGACMRVAPGWLEALRAACLAQPDIGTASPLHLVGPDTLLPAAKRARGADTQIALADERCVYLRRDCLAATGPLRTAPFAQGSGAIADFCLRATALGWRHIAAAKGVAARVAPAPTPAWRALEARNRQVLAQLHPGFAAPDPPAAARRPLAAALLRQSVREGDSVLLVSHGDGGGVEQLLGQRRAVWRAQGRRPLVLRPDGAAGWCVLEDDAASESRRDLRFDLPRELPALASLLRALRVTLMEVHHLLGHHHSVLALARHLAIPYDMFVHDYASFCPRINLMGREARYCGEPDLAGCRDCIADLGSNLEEDIDIAALRRRSAEDMAAARRVVVPARDVAARLRRHFPTLRATVMAWEPDTAPPPPTAPGTGRTRICLAGALGLAKGFEILLACARDCASRALPLEFVVVGHTIDDGRLMDTGRVFVTGAYDQAEAVPLITAQNATLGFLPSLVPETWCYALSHLWAAGLGVVAFDMGAPAERIRGTGAGQLLPLGLHPAAINQALLAYRPQVGFDHAPRGRSHGMSGI